MAQVWHDLLFAHWRIPVTDLLRLIPPPLALDTHQGQAWITLAAFRMSGIRPRGLFPCPWISAFPELNVRTYVTLDDAPGVFFFSLDAANRLAVAVARRWYHLPYFHARMSLGWTDGRASYSSRRVQRGAPPAEFRARYRPAGEVFRAAPGSLDHWLTERYCLYSIDPRGGAWRARIHHGPWPLQRAEAEFEVNTMTTPLGLAPPPAPPLLHFAARLEVVAWSPERI